MNPSVYVETSVVSYLTARPSRDVVVAAYQEVTREWWRSAPGEFVLYVSALVISEARTGDPEAAARSLGHPGDAPASRRDGAGSRADREAAGPRGRPAQRG